MQKLDAIGTLFANSWKRFEEKFATTVAIFVAPVVLVALTQLLFLQKTPIGDVLGGVLEIVAIIVSILASYALVSAFGKNTGFAASYQTGVKVFWSGVWITILVCLAVFGGFIMLIIPGIMLAFQLSFTSYALILDDKRGMAALAQSRAYVTGYWWAFVGRSLLLILVFLIAELVIIAPLTVLLGGVAGIILSAAFTLFITPFAVSYQYEIFHNLRRLKPDVAAEAGKIDEGFVKVSMVVGIVGVVFVPILVVAAIAFLGPKFSAQWRAQYPNGYQYSWPAGTATSSIQISPTSGPVGTSVMISGVDAGALGATETVLMNNLVAERDVPVASDGSLMFTVPSTLGPNCDPTQVCPQFLMQTSPKTYTISLEQNAQDPNPVEVGMFTVVGSSIGTVNPGGPIQPVQPLE